ncbi:DUF1330 domain-containing protein [Methylotenera sp. N17]|uniref:DUF1330 domain-containing protein n=1 Tax=Methylotenera sp. N17 TaxID=1502761 RepID=UPI001F36CF15|nr:DUF1330 domain-containing protein [Methylotenera sp. N17]
MMSAYVVMIRERTLDQDEMVLYAQLAKSAREGHQVTPLARYGAMEVLEGSPAEGCLIHEFPTIKDAQNWYHSAKYQEALKHRLKGAEYRVLIVEGLEA